MKDIAKSKEKIIEELEKRLSKDLTYDSGFILGSMCSEPLKFATEIYSKYISKNLGDPNNSAPLSNECQCLIIKI